jgi:hypothetical protein
MYINNHIHKFLADERITELAGETGARKRPIDEPKRVPVRFVKRTGPYLPIIARGVARLDDYRRGARRS